MYNIHISQKICNPPLTRTTTKIKTPIKQRQACECRICHDLFALSRSMSSICHVLLLREMIAMSRLETLKNECMRIFNLSNEQFKI